MAANHTFGESCMLKEESNTFTRRASSVAIDPPKIHAQFFYRSAQIIDDPLAAVPTPSSGSAVKPSKIPPRPFSVHDNIALDQAWLKLPLLEQAQAQAQKKPYLRKDVLQRESTESELYAASIPPKAEAGEVNANEPTQDTQKGKVSEMGKETEDRGVSDVSKAQTEYHLGVKPQGVDLTLFDDPDHPPLQDTMPITVDEIVEDEVESGIRKSHRSRSLFRRKEREEKSEEDIVSSRSSNRKWSRGRHEVDESAFTLGRSPDTTGTPFLRVSSRLRRSSKSPDRGTTRKAQVDGVDSPGKDYRPKQSSPLGVRPRFPSSHSSEDSQDEDHSGTEPVSGGSHSVFRREGKLQETQTTRVTVGISRLHVVEMPSLKVSPLKAQKIDNGFYSNAHFPLQMGPIYWDPVHDESAVVRGTWFYKDTMWPVESDLANQIEEGYDYMRPWTPAYVDELNSCMDIGPEAELKVCHRIWLSDMLTGQQSRPGTGKGKRLEPEVKQLQEAKVVAGMAENRAEGILGGSESTDRLFARSSMIYANARDAQILSTSQLPSAKTGRRVLSNIRKGRAVGIPVVRGFDTKAWEKLHPLPTRAVTIAQTIEAGTVKSLKRQKSCLACEEGAGGNSMPTDLILVVHGIGQKLSERVESFHFTHAINAFRRQINLELNADAVKPWLRPELGGVMVLPINWRSTLKLEDGGPQPDPNRRPGSPNPLKNEFTLKDITAESLPAVRNLISDVMLDIPYYLSHHKPKMIEAVIREANRVYRLWCLNNPHFHESGRVHLLAHSLGSVMALDILSKQPTKLPKEVDYPHRSGDTRTDIFEFDTRSLFFCGSPAGFFLLLNRAPLVPRSGRDKPDAESKGTGPGVAGEPGTFGCLAVDNLYNIMHYNDPVAYRLNACVDVDYAASLQPASVPSATPTWGQFFGGYVRGKAVVPTKTMSGLNELPRRPTTARLPTTVEMETHDFTKEEIAEKRMFLLNDNGQIDYTLHSGGGPLEIQYLNMLSAHSSYWTLQDFVRFLVVEVGRKPGRAETMGSVRAVKKGFGKK